MKYCEKCDSKLVKGSKFCEACGAKVEVAENTSEQVNEKEQLQSQPKPPKQKVERKSLTKTQKTIGASLIGIILLLFIGYNIGSSVYSESNQRDDIIESIQSKDPKKLAEIVTTYDPTFEVNAENLESFAAYLESNPNYLNNLVNGLEIYGRYDSFYIQKKGSILGLYDAFGLVMDPIYGTVHTNIEGTVVSVNGAEAWTSDSSEMEREIGPYAPGILTLSATGEIDGFPLTTSEEVEWLSTDTFNLVDLSLYGHTFRVESDLPDATVYIDDQEIGALVDGYGEFGPVQVEEGMKLRVEKVFDNDEIVSEPVDFTEDNSYYSFTNLTMGSSNDAYRLINNMYREVSNGVRNYGDDTEESITEFYHSDGPAYDDQRNQFITLAKSNHENEDVTNVDFDVTLNSFKQVGAYSFDVEYEVTFNTRYHYSLDMDPIIKHYSKEATVYFEPTNNPKFDYVSSIYEIRNEKLLYEE